ncbi:peptide chain release factor 1 (macronuclear) [Tetrahymena thermophila SB210]|uniref:Peptide chain release factor 1 n=1 Tax=Tetrahymena thermophila (strain SB210) TaxID=312017 RepID=Q22RW5_TETTS|nr:peptide chain release factor 1 [Tetrahymena thermophila SB210]EAR88007.2 peptide chain release factor 1 [Tetrahymena thermophila SB210]|eukprot:XP_001008252.2 peptide chain release factor 1 [Tetrahymena thermophila SB210]
MIKNIFKLLPISLRAIPLKQQQNSFSQICSLYNTKLFKVINLIQTNNKCFFSFRAKETFKKKTSSLEIETHFQVSDLTRCIYRRMKQFHNEYTDIQKILSQEQQQADINLEQLRKKINVLQPLNDVFEKLEQNIKTLQELQKQKEESASDPEMLALIEEEMENSKQLIDELQDECLEQLLPKGKHDDCSEITLEVRGGAGGSESSLFAEEVFKMYQAFFAQQGYQFSIDSFQVDMAINKGCKLGVLKVSGTNIYKKMMNESGVHKVIRVPETESKGRLHSSTISVVVMPVVPMDFKVDEKDLKFEFMRSQGAGGQHVNKVESACRVTHLPTGISVLCQDDRQQERNKQRALKLLTEKLFQVEVEKSNQQQSDQRKSQIGGGDRSDKIRTYNFPQGRITDHRTNLTLFGIEKMMKGEFLEEFIDEYEEKVNNELIESVLKQLEEDENQSQPKN